MNNIISKYYPQLLLLILAFSFFTRIYRLHIPEKYVFDEVYHAVTAKLILENDTRAYEWHNPPPEPDTAVDWLHPPLAKYTQALSMMILAKNSFGWRFSSAIFGMLAVFLTSKLAFNLFQKKTIALLAALIVSLDGLVLTMSRIAMNDIHVTVFILMAFNFYTIFLNSKRKKTIFLFLAAISSGLAMGTKWSGLFSLLTIGFFEAINLITNFFSKLNKRNLVKKIINNSKKTVFLALILLVLPVSIYILSYAHMFMLGKDFTHLIEMHKNTWWYQTTMDATHPAQSRPIEWFFNTKPVWINVTWGNNVRGDIYAFGNPALFWIGDIFIFVSFVYLIYLMVQSYQKNKITSKLKRFFFFFFSYFAVWLPWQISPRIMFFYHYLPAVPLLSINLAFWINKLFEGNKFQKSLAIIILVAIIVAFVVWYPHWVGIEMPIEIKDNLYFALQSWRQN